MYTNVLHKAVYIHSHSTLLETPAHSCNYALNKSGCGSTVHRIMQRQDQDWTTEDVFGLFSALFCENTRDCCAKKKIQKMWNIEILGPACLTPATMPWSKAWRSHFFPQFWCLMWTWTESSDMYLHDFMHYTASTQLADRIISRLYRCSY